MNDELRSYYRSEWKQLASVRDRHEALSQPLLRLTWKIQFNGAGPATYAADGLRIHPRLARKGKEAVREALRERAEELRSEAARKLDKAACVRQPA